MTSIVTIKGKPIIDIYESFDGSYWYITEKCHKQDSVIDGKVYKDDQILFGYARLSMCPESVEFGYVSETELELLGRKVWKVPRKKWSTCPGVEVQEILDNACIEHAPGREEPSSRSSTRCSIVCKEVNEKMQSQVLIAGTPVIDIWQCFNGRCWYITKRTKKEEQYFLSGYVRCLDPVMLAEFQHLPEEVFSDLGEQIDTIPHWT